jgi:excisionase family DNA binding protein
MLADMDGTGNGAPTVRDGAGGTGHVPSVRVTVAEAAELLGVNVVTIRRMIKRGQLEAERVHRPQGSAYLVMLPGHGAGDGTLTEQPAQDMSRTDGAATPAPAEAMVSLIQTTIATVLGPLVGQVDAQRQTIERQAAQLVSQAETIGELRAELAAERRAQSPVASNLTPEPSDPTPGEPSEPFSWPLPPQPNVRVLAPWLVAVLAIVTVGMMLWTR